MILPSSRSLTACPHDGQRPVSAVLVSRWVPRPDGERTAFPARWRPRRGRCSGPCRGVRDHQLAGAAVGGRVPLVAGRPEDPPCVVAVAVVAAVGAEEDVPAASAVPGGAGAPLPCVLACLPGRPAARRGRAECRPGQRLHVHAAIGVVLRPEPWKRPLTSRSCQSTLINDGSRSVICRSSGPGALPAPSAEGPASGAICRFWCLCGTGPSATLPRGPAAGRPVWVAAGEVPAVVTHSCTAPGIYR
jgi:hypothetical protein